MSTSLEGNYCMFYYTEQIPAPRKNFVEKTYQEYKYINVNEKE